MCHCKVGAASLRGRALRIGFTGKMSVGEMPELLLPAALGFGHLPGEGGLGTSFSLLGTHDDESRSCPCGSDIVCVNQWVCPPSEFCHSVLSAPISTTALASVLVSGTRLIQRILASLKRRMFASL